MTDDSERVIGVVREQGVDYDTNGEAIPWTDVYVKVKVAFRQKALKLLKGPKLSCFLCVALHVGNDGTAHPSIDTVMRETGYSRSIVCNALADLEKLGFIEKQRRKHDSTLYHIRGYVWFGSDSKPTLLGEVQSSKSELSKPQSRGSKRLESESLPNEPKDNPSPKDQPTTTKDNLGSGSEKPDSDFPETPAPPSPGGADSGKETDHGRTDVDIDTGGGAAATSGHDTGNHHGHSGEVEADPVVEAIIEQTMTRPDQFALGRATAAAREKAGNWAVPVQAGGDAPIAEVALVAMYEAIDSEPPATATGWTKAHEIISQVLRDYGIADAEMARDAGKAFGQANVETPHFVNPYLSSFPAAFGIYVGRAKKQAAKPDRRARYDTPAVHASQAALVERKAARDPPPKDDRIGGAIKVQLHERMDQPTYDTYVKPTCFACDDGVLVVTAPTAFTKDWLENRLGLTIRRTLNDFTDGPQEVRFETHLGTEPPEEAWE